MTIWGHSKAPLVQRGLTLVSRILRLLLAVLSKAAYFSLSSSW
jgi:hypothetical protein